MAVYKRLKDAVNSGSTDAVWELIESEVKIRWHREVTHNYFCAAETPPNGTVCSSCEALLEKPVEREDFGMISLLLFQCGACPSRDMCAAGLHYNGRKTSAPPFKLAVESGSLNDVRQLLSQGADINTHPRICVKNLNCQSTMVDQKNVTNENATEK